MFRPLFSLPYTGENNADYQSVFLIFEVNIKRNYQTRLNDDGCGFMRKWAFFVGNFEVFCWRGVKKQKKLILG